MERKSNCLIGLGAFAIYRLTIFILRAIPLDDSLTWDLAVGAIALSLPSILLIPYLPRKIRDTVQKSSQWYLLLLTVCAMSLALFGFSMLFPRTILPVTNDQLYAQALSSLLIAPILEECLFRRVIFTSFLPLGNFSAALASAILFALSHGAYPSMLYAMISGVALSFLYLSTGNLLLPIIAHFFLNSLTFLSDYLPMGNDIAIHLFLFVLLVSAVLSILRVKKTGKDQ